VVYAVHGCPSRSLEIEQEIGLHAAAAKTEIRKAPHLCTCAVHCAALGRYKKGGTGIKATL
jgi:hypothetical protein